MTRASDPPATPDLERLNDLLDGRLGAAEERILRARLEREPALRAAMERLAALSAGVREALPGGAGLEAPPEFGARLRARLDAEAARARAGRRWRRALTAAYAVAALVVAGVSTAWILDLPEESAPTQTAGGAEPAPERAPAGEWQGDLGAKAAAAGAPDAARPRSALAEEAAEPAPGALGAPRARGAGPDGASPRAPQEGAPAPLAARGGRFGAPGGSVQPGLRVPSDEPPARAGTGGAPDEEARDGRGAASEAGAAQGPAPLVAEGSASAPGSHPPAAADAEPQTFVLLLAEGQEPDAALAALARERAARLAALAEARAGPGAPAPAPAGDAAPPGAPAAPTGPTSPAPSGAAGDAPGAPEAGARKGPPPPPELLPLAEYHARLAARRLEAAREKRLPKREARAEGPHSLAEARERLGAKAELIRGLPEGLTAADLADEPLRLLHLGPEDPGRAALPAPAAQALVRVLVLRRR